MIKNFFKTQDLAERKEAFNRKMKEYIEHMEEKKSK